MYRNHKNPVFNEKDEKDYINLKIPFIINFKMYPKAIIYFLRIYANKQKMSVTVYNDCRLAGCK